MGSGWQWRPPSFLAPSFFLLVTPYFFPSVAPFRPVLKCSVVVVDVHSMYSQAFLLVLQQQQHTTDRQTSYFLSMPTHPPLTVRIDRYRYGVHAWQMHVVCRMTQCMLVCMAFRSHAPMLLKFRASCAQKVSVRSIDGLGQRKNCFYNNNSNGDKDFSEPRWEAKITCTQFCRKSNDRMTT